MQLTRTTIVLRLAFLLLLTVCLPSEGQEAGTSVRSGTGSVSLGQRGVTGLTGERQFNLQFRPTDTGELLTGSIRVTGADGFTGATSVKPTGN